MLKRSCNKLTATRLDKKIQNAYVEIKRRPTIMIYRIYISRNKPNEEASFYVYLVYLISNMIAECKVNNDSN